MDTALAIILMCDGDKVHTSENILGGRMSWTIEELEDLYDKIGWKEENETWRNW